MAKYNALQIANWFICRAKSDVEENGGEYLTHLKLQKLLYYAQGGFLGIKNECLFDDPIEAWAHGPVVPNVYQKYKNFVAKPIIKCEIVDIDIETVAVLEDVYDTFGQYSALKLREMTHREDPWVKTDINKVIDIDLIKEYFKSNHIA